MKKGHQYASLTRPGQGVGRTRLGVDVPLLLNGDHLTVPEFERRYEAMPESCKAELIEGIVVMAPPVSSDHGESHVGLSQLLTFYALHTDGVAAGICASFRIDGRNEYQPDVFLRVKDPHGRSKIAPDGLIDGAPELVAEIAVSSAGYDLHEKKRVYERCGAQEYLVWQVRERQFHWFALDKGAYVKLEDQDGILKSRVFPGLWIDARGLLAGEGLKALRALERGLKSAAHKTFVKNLKKSA